ncbi:MAG TPA: hypothetical protein VF300_00735 [Methanothrix sp.]
MKNSYYLAILMLLMSSSTVLVASAQDQVALTVHVYDGDFNGTLLSDVSLSGQDAAGNSFQTVTDSNGAAVVAGQPGAWQFTFTKEGYDPLSLNYDVAATGDGYVYLQKTAPTPSVDNIAMTIYVHEGDLNGTMLSGVQMVGQDAAGNIFQGLTDSNGLVVASGKPGTWQFNFTKEGYKPLSLSYEVTQTDEGAVYLESADQPQGYQEEAASSQSYQLLNPISSGTQSSQVGEAERMNQD